MMLMPMKVWPKSHRQCAWCCCIAQYPCKDVWATERRYYTLQACYDCHNKWAGKFSAMTASTSVVGWDTEGQGLLVRKHFGDLFVIYESWFDCIIEACKEQLSYGTTTRAQLYAVMDKEMRYWLDGEIVSTVEPWVVMGCWSG